MLRNLTKAKLQIETYLDFSFIEVFFLENVSEDNNIIQVLYSFDLTLSFGVHASEGAKLEGRRTTRAPADYPQIS